MEYRLSDRAQTTLANAVASIETGVDKKNFTANIEVDLETGEISIYPLYSDGHGRATFEPEYGISKHILVNIMTKNGLVSKPSEAESE